MWHEAGVEYAVKRRRVSIVANTTVQYHRVCPSAIVHYWALVLGRCVINGQVRRFSKACPVLLNDGGCRSSSAAG